MHPDDYDWLHDPEFECVCAVCNIVLPRRLTHLWYGDLYCDKCFELLTSNGNIYNSSSETEF